MTRFCRIEGAYICCVIAFATSVATAPLACAETARELDSTPEDAGPTADIADAAPIDGGPSSDDASADAQKSDACSAGGFCYVPLPVHGPLLHVSASSMDDAWAVGSDFIVHWDGISWKHVYQYSGPGSIAFFGISATKPDNVWAFARTDTPATDTPETSQRLFIVRYSKRDGREPLFRELRTSESVGNKALTDTLGLFWQMPTWVTPASDALWLADDIILSATRLDVRRFREEPDGSLVVDRFTPQAGREDEWAYAWTWTSLWGFGPDDIYVGGTAQGSSTYGVIAHYNGRDWSITFLDAPVLVLQMFGTTALNQQRQLWYWLFDPYKLFFADRDSLLRLVPISNDGSMGAPLFTDSTDRYCSVRNGIIGAAVSASATWLSFSCLVYRWNGTKLEVIPTSSNGDPPGRVNGIWAGSADDAWIVGEALPYQGPAGPALGFAAQRRSEWLGDR